MIHFILSLGVFIFCNMVYCSDPEYQPKVAEFQRLLREANQLQAQGLSTTSPEEQQSLILQAEAKRSQALYELQRQRKEVVANKQQEKKGN